MNQGRLTAQQIANATGLNVRTVREHIQRVAAKKGKDNRYPTAEILASIQRAAERDGDNQKSGSLKDVERRLKCEILKTKLLQIRGQLIPLTEVVSGCGEYSAIVNAVFDHWINAVRALTADPRLVGEAERLRDEARARICANIEALQTQVDTKTNPK